MKKNILISVVLVIFTLKAHAQLTNHRIHDEATAGLGLGRVQISENSSSYNLGRKVGFYTSISGDIAYYNFEQWKIRYYLDLKWISDLLYKAGELWKGTGTDPRTDFTSITWHKLGLNVFANDNFCVGIGGSFSDYIVDIPDWNTNGNYANGFTWKEPSGWHWTAGPALFFDAGIGDFIATLTVSYDYTYLHPKISNDYEALTNKISGYASPNFFYWDITINHESGLYLSFDRTKMIDNGVSKTMLTRNDFQLGFRFLM